MNNRQAIILAALTLGGGWVAGAQNRPNVQVFQAEAGMQVVLESIPTADGKMWVRPKSPVYFRLSPKDALAHYAPLPPHSLMVCREFNYAGDQGERHAAFRCGTDEYALDAFGFSRGAVEGDAEPHKAWGAIPAGR